MFPWITLVITDDPIEFKKPKPDVFINDFRDERTFARTEPDTVEVGRG
jgi:hypothetical protein